MRSLTLLCSFVAILGGGCALTPDLPRHFSIDDSFVNDASSPDVSIDEPAIILAGAEAWNAVCREYLGTDCLVFDGLVSISGGFTLESLSDDKHIVYRGVDDAIYQFLASEQNYGTNGFGTWEDVLLFTFQIAKVYNRDDDGKITIRPATAEEFPNRLLSTSIHEFGHFLGLTHDMDVPDSAMYCRGTLVVAITDRDIENFCHTYSCIKDPP